MKGESGMMKKFLLVVCLAVVCIGSIGIGKAQAVPTPEQWLFSDLGDWGRLYSYAPGAPGTYTTTAPPNPYWPGYGGGDTAAGTAWTAGLAISLQGGDVYEDTWGVAQVDEITRDAGATTVYDNGFSAYEITVMFEGFNDEVLFDVQGATTQILSTGGKISVYQDFSQDYLDDADGGGGSAGGYVDGVGSRTGQETFTGATNGTKVLELVARATPTLDAFGNVVMATLTNSFNFNTLAGLGSIAVDSQAGYAWHDKYNTDSQVGGTDFVFSFSSQAGQIADWTVNGSADAFTTIDTVPEPTTVALLGIGLVGMAGVAVRKKFKKNVVGKI